MKHTQITKDGNIIAKCNGWDICQNGIPGTLQKQAPCEVRYMEGEEAVRVVNVKRATTKLH